MPWGNTGGKSIFDELYGYINLNELETRIVDTPVFQRLRRIKQLALAWYVYPGAVHTRFSHSLGVMHVMGVIASRLSEEGYISRDDVQILKVAALLHDVGHTPYSHAIEQYFVEKFGLRHEDISYWVIREDPHLSEVLGEYGIDPNEVSAIIRGRHREVTYNALMSSDLDVDRLDYLRRDAHHTGVAYGLIDAERILHTLTVDGEGRLAIPRKAVQAVESFYIARMHMYRSVYHHKTISAYQILVNNIYRSILEDEELSEYLAPFTAPEGVRKAIREGVFHLWDDFYVGGILNLILIRGERRGSELEKLIRSYLLRRGYRTLFEELVFGKGDNPIPEDLRERVREFMEALREEGLSENYVKPYMEVLPLVGEEEAVRVLSNGKSIKISEFKDSIISTMPEVMGLVRIYCLPEAIPKVADLVSKFFNHNVSI